MESKKKIFINPLKSIYFKTPIYNFILNKNSSSEISIIVNDPWEGEKKNGMNILNGYVSFFGETIHFKNSIWEKNFSSKEWSEQLHSFSWIRDIRSIGSNAARIFLRNELKNWMKSFNSWKKFEWRNDILGKRICYLLGSFNFFYSSADDDFQKIILQSIHKQGLHLIKNSIDNIFGFKRIFVIKGIIAVSITFKNLNEYLSFGLKLLLKEIKEQVLVDGCHYQKSPSNHSEFLENLIDIRSYLVHANFEPPKEVNNCISEMATVLKFFKNNNGLLPSFNNSNQVDKNKIDQIIIRANSKKKVPNFLIKSGFQRVSKNKLNFIMDCGSPSSENTYAGSLSFEFTVGKNKLVINCGSPYINNNLLSEAMRSTAAHSTVSIDNINSSDIFFNSHKKSGRIAKVWSSRKEQQGSYWINSAHSGYKNIFGLTHSRKIHIDSEKKILRGQDYFSQTEKKYQRIAKKYFLRFHLFPNIEISSTVSKKKAILKLPDGTGWEFICSEPKVEIKESVYLGDAQKIIKTNHILINGNILPEKKIKWLFKSIR